MNSTLHYNLLWPGICSIIDNTCRKLPIKGLEVIAMADFSEDSKRVCLRAAGVEVCTPTINSLWALVEKDKYGELNKCLRNTYYDLWYYHNAI